MSVTQSFHTQTLSHAKLNAGSQSADEINSPSHYLANGLETIEVIEAFELNFNLGNVLKYILRAGRKTPEAVKDLKKASYYLTRELNYLEAAQCD